ncbi:hypothetical protein [Sandarakinorhabdus sp.]|uniref:hypothetical protein n=1 Tax=Sandarakinorhabdus sp. TaxID=1916663 RepID=UPI003566ED94
MSALPGPLEIAVAAQDVREGVAGLPMEDQVAVLLAVLVGTGARVQPQDQRLFIALVEEVLREKLSGVAP